MSVRERILTIRLLDLVARNPVYAAALGISSGQEAAGPDDRDDPPKLPDDAVINRVDKLKGEMTWELS